MEQIREDTNLGLVLSVRECCEFETRSLMDYVREFHTDPTRWYCDSDGCEASRQLESELGWENTRVEKFRERKFTITQAPEILCVELKRLSYKKVKGRLIPY